MLLPRFLTALVGVPFLLAAIYFGALPYFFLMVGIALLGLREFYHLADKAGYPCYSWLGIAVGILILVSIFLNGLGFGQLGENQGTAAVLSLGILAIVLRSLTRGPADTTLSEWAVTLFPVFYVSWPLGHLLLLRDLRPEGQTATYFLFILIWTADIVAYFIGSRWGRRPIAPSISPKKSWEGTIAAVVSSLIVSSVFYWAGLRAHARMPELWVLGIVMVILAFWSDLGESMLKRSAGAKDSSPLLPGHGGILDRFDSLLLTAPAFYYYWAFLKH